MGFENIVSSLMSSVGFTDALSSPESSVGFTGVLSSLPSSVGFAGVFSLLSSLCLAGVVPSEAGLGSGHIMFQALYS